MTAPDRPSSSAGEEAATRREFLGTVSSVAMAGGLVAGYGTFVAMAARFLYAESSAQSWLYVTQVDRIGPEESISFRSPEGLHVTVTRRAGGPEGETGAGQFLALSSVCPHLGCRVHWEPHRDRFFCPCHNGVFDPDGVATAGPPKDAGQRLSTYPLRVEQGMLFIQMPQGLLG